MNPSSAMRHLLWKDFRQIRPAFVACWVMLAIIQLLYFAAQWLDEDSSMSIFQDVYFIALVSPTLVAIACSGLLIGQERQSRTWNWSSSLPITWSSALASKFVVWLVASVAMTLLLLALYAVLYRIAWLSGRVPTKDAIWQISEARIMFAMLMLIPLEVFVIFSIAALLWNDTLLALVVAAIALCAGHLLVVDIGTRAIHGIPWKYPLRLQDYLPTVVALLVAATALASLGLCFAFRWRWTSGQLASLSLREWVRIGLGTRAGSASLAYAPGYPGVVSSQGVFNALTRQIGKPSETVMMLLHAWRSALGIRLTVAIAALALLALAPGEWYIFPQVIVFASLLVGATVFGSEHPLGRYRFFADRGASWLRFLITHVLVAFLWLLGLLALAYWLVSLQLGNRPRPWLDFADPSIFVVALCAFGLAVFSSLCITNSVIATTLAAIALFTCGILYQVVDSFLSALLGQSGHAFVGVPLTAAIVLVGLVYQARRWFIFDQPRSLNVLVGSGLVGLIFPIWLCMTFGYLAIPSTQWQGVPADQFNAGAQARLPQFKTHLSAPIASMPLPAVSTSPTMAQELIADSFRDQLEQVQQRFGGIPAWLDARKASLEELRAELSDPDAFAPVAFAPINVTSFSVLLYSDWIEQTAFVAVAATQARDRELALTAWRLNRSLLKLGEGSPDLAVRSLAARAATWGLWSLLDDDDLAFLEEYADLDSLLPGHVDNAVWSQALRVRWTRRELELRSDGLQDLPAHVPEVFQWALRYYPPLRWAVERQMSHQLNEELASLQSHRPLATPERPSWFAAHDPIVYQLPLLHQFEEQVTAKVARVQPDDKR